MGAHEYGKLGHVLRSDAREVHVLRGHERVVSGHRGAVRHFVIHVAHLRQRLDGTVAGLARETVFASEHQHIAAAARAHQLARRHQHGGARSAPQLHAMRVVRPQGQTLAHQGGEHQVRQGGGITAQHAINLAALQAAAINGQGSRLVHQIQRAAPLVPPEGRSPRAAQISRSQ